MLGKALKMMQIRTRFRTILSGLVIFVMGMGLTGCGLLSGSTNSGNPPLQVSTEKIPLQTGQKITVTFSDIPNPPPALDQTIREDGMITLPLGVELKAAGKTVGELIDDIRKAYVPEYYRRLTVTVKPENRFYFVVGQVRNPNRYVYAGDMTVLKAIGSAGDFTDFANRRNVELTRANGQRFKVNANKAQKDPELDLPVFPGDRIHVKRRWW